MPPNRKTDNGNLAGKLHLRRYFMERYHADGSALVFDACQGSGVLWAELRRDFDCTYWGVDTKTRPGRLSVDSVRVLAQPGWTFDIVDIDTYGSPWKHWEQVLKNASRPTTVFLTIGATMHKGSVDAAALRALGLDELAHRIPESLKGKLSDFSVAYCLAMSYNYGWKVALAMEAPPNRRTRYVGVRLEPATKNAPATGGHP